MEFRPSRWHSDSGIQSNIDEGREALEALRKVGVDKNDPDYESISSSVDAFVDEQVRRGMQRPRS